MTRALGVRVGYTAREECPHGYVGLLAPQASHPHPLPGAAVVAVSCGMAAIQVAHSKQIHLHLGLSEAEMWATRPSNQSRTSDSCCERHTYLQPSASSVAGVAGHLFSAEPASPFSWARKSQHIFSSTHPCFGMYDLGMSLGIQRCVYIPFPGLHDHAENTRTPVCCRHSFLGACQRLFV